MNTDRLGLNEHKIFGTLREYICTLLEGKCWNILACKYDTLFIWDGMNYCLLTLALKPFFRHFEEDVNKAKYQTLRASNMPYENVRYIVLSEHCKQVALVGENRICILDLPERWGVDAEFERGKPVITCTTRTLALAGLNETVLQARWHPASPGDNHLVVLYSDGILRIFNTHTSEIAHVVIMGIAHRKRGYSTLGDSAVDFDICPPLTRTVKRKQYISTMEEIVWPILVLWGNGDVLYTITTFTADDIKTILVRGPLQMFPPADDNYGSDASAIMIMDSTPPIVVISSCSGTIYHALLLETYNVRREVDVGVWPAVNITVEHNVALHVFETAELELGLSITGEKADNVGAYSCPVRLMKDYNFFSRYLCIHETGVHLVTMPIALQLKSYAESSSDDISKYIQSFSQHISTIEYLMCTRVNDSDALTPIGVCIIPSPDTLLVLLSSSEVISILLPFLHPPITSCIKETSEKVKPKTEEPKEGFDDYIKSILTPSVPAPRFPPLLKLDRKRRITYQEQLEILSKAVLFFRNEVFPRHETAISEIKKRVKALSIQKQHQEEGLQFLEKCKNELKNKAEQLAERYEEINEKQVELMKRSEHVLLQTRSRSAYMTRAEMKMVEQVKEFKRRFDETDKVMEQVRSRFSAHKRSEIKMGKEVERKQEKRTSVLTEKQAKHTKEALAQLTEDISTLMMRVKNIKTIIQKEL